MKVNTQITVINGVRGVMTCGEAAGRAPNRQECSKACGFKPFGAGGERWV